jgi:hypothetical protein
MTWTQGDLLTETFSHVEGDGDPITGATWTVVSSRDPDGASFLTAADITELGLGDYQITYQTDSTSPLGEYHAQIRSGIYVKNLDWFLDAPSGYTVSTLPAGVGITRRDIRRMVLERIGDLTICEATSAGNVNKLTFNDLDNLYEPSGTFAGKEVMFTAGTSANIGEVRRVVGNTRDTGTITLNRALPAQTQTGDQCELVNTYGTGITFQSIHRAIDTTLTMSGMEIPVMAEIATAFDRQDRAISIPAELTAIERVQYQTTNGYEWVNLDKARGLGENGWAINHGERTLYVGHTVGYQLHGRSIRIIGYARASALESDSDVCPVDPEWVIHQTLSNLLMKSIGTSRVNIADWERKGLFSDQKSERLAFAAMPRHGANYTRV